MNEASMTAHGYGPYSKGCRCTVCRKAKADYMRARRAEARALAQRAAASGRQRYVDGITHGRVGYAEHGCRCRICVSAATANRASLPSARRVGAVQP